MPTLGSIAALISLIDAGSPFLLARYSRMAAESSPWGRRCRGFDGRGIVASRVDRIASTLTPGRGNAKHCGRRCVVQLCVLGAAGRISTTARSVRRHGQSQRRGQLPGPLTAPPWVTQHLLGLGRVMTPAQAAAAWAYRFLTLGVAGEFVEVGHEHEYPTGSLSDRPLQLLVCHRRPGVGLAVGTGFPHLSLLSQLALAGIEVEDNCAHG